MSIWDKATGTNFMCDEIECVYTFLGACFVNPPDNPRASIFGFAEFVSALTLLVIVYTISNFRYHFRIAVAPIPLFFSTFILVGIIGLGSLFTDLWYAEKLPVPTFMPSQVYIQSGFGLLFLFTILVWMYFAFINPSIFGKLNYKKFSRKLFRIVLKGSESELPVIADEIGRSAESIVKHSSLITRHELSEPQPEKWKWKNDANKWAYEILLLIGNRKFCRHVIASSPGTAIKFFLAMDKEKKYGLPIGQFASNITTEALLNRDSNLYHEDSGYSSGLFGYRKPFSEALYGNYQLVENIGNSHITPLDINFDVRRTLDAPQLEAYANIVLITFKSYLKDGWWGTHSYSLFRALDIFENIALDLYMLDGTVTNFYDTDTYKKLRVSVRFLTDAIQIIEDQPSLPSTTLRLNKDAYQNDYYDNIAKIFFKFMIRSVTVKGDEDLLWMLMHNSIWIKLQGFRKGKAWNIVRHKVRRLIYDEIITIEKMSNFENTALLGYCLFVMGLKFSDRTSYGKEYYALRKVILEWTKRNYLYLRSLNKILADKCLVGSISYDDSKHRLVKTYISILGRPPKQDFLDLDASSGKFI